jgi:ATP-binding cassette subfamily B protein
MRALGRLLPYYRPYRRQLAGGIALVVLGAAIASVGPWLLRGAIDGIRIGTPLSRTVVRALEIVGVALVAGTMRYGMRELLNGMSRRIEYDLRNDLYQHLLALDSTYFGRTRTGDLMARLTNDLSAVRMAAGPAIMYLANTVAGGIFALGFMLHIDRRLTLIAALPMVLLPVLMVRVGPRIHARFEAVQDHFGTLTTRVQENLAGTRIVRAYRQEAAEETRFAALNNGYVARNMHLVRLYGVLNPSFGLLAGLGMVAVLWNGGSLVLAGSISVGAFVAFGLYLGMLTWPLIALGWVINLFQRGGASMGRLNEIFDARAVVAAVATPRALPSPPHGGGRSIEYRGVGFHYPMPRGSNAAPRWVLREISFRIPAGGTLGVVGATGSGKSALLDLIPRLYDPQEGEILLDGVPIRELSLGGLRAELGVVPQESLLFSDTIRANLVYGGDDDANGRWAADVAQLDATIREFPGGYDTMLGERGINLSGGQKQRAALARALARKPSVVLLDDALSAVDTHTEAEILRGLGDALRGRTTIVASHRISAIRDATCIIVLDDGRIVEQGRHEELLALGGRYWSLLRRQQLEDALDDGGANGESTGDELARDVPTGRIPA